MKMFKPIKVAILPILGLFQINTTNDGKVQVTGGYEADLLKMLFQGLKASYELTVPEDLQFGKKQEDGNWTGLIGMLDRKQAGVAISDTFMTEERKSVVDFSYPYAFGGVTFATQLPRHFQTQNSFIYPFTIHLLLLIISSFVVFPILVKYLFSKPYSLHVLGFEILRSVLKQPITLKHPNIADKLMLMSWMLAVFIISLSYSSVLLSFLAVPLQEKVVKDVKEMANAVKDGKMKCFLVETSSGLIRTLSEHEDESVRFLMAEILKNNWILRNDPNIIGMEVFSEMNALIGPASEFCNYLNQDAFISDDIFHTYPTGIALRKKFKLKKSVDKIMHRISASGLYRKNVKDYLFKKKLKFEKLYDVPASRLTINNLEEAFYILIFGYALSVCLFIAEILYFKFEDQ